jgi:hypothetical protein
MSRRRAPLSARARGILERLAAAQRATGGAVAPDAVIRSSSVAEWDSIQVLCQRMLVGVTEGRLRLTRAGWSAVNGRP